MRYGKYHSWVLRWKTYYKSHAKTFSFMDDGIDLTIRWKVEKLSQVLRAKL